MRMSKRWAVGGGILALGAALMAGTVGPAAANAPLQRAPERVQIEQLTLRLADHPGQVANVEGASRENGARVIQWPLARTTNERWAVRSTGGGYYRFQSVHSGKCLNVEGGGRENGAKIIQYTCGESANEQWRLEPRGRGYQLVARSSGKCLNVSGGVRQGRGLIQYTCGSGSANEVWLPVWEDNEL